MVADPLFLAYLAQFDDEAWLRVVDRLEPAIHPVDRAATRAWFHFYPLRLQQAVDAASDPRSLTEHLRLQGQWRLDEQCDTSHWFLYGHRYWPEIRELVHRAAATALAPGSLDLAAVVQEVAREAANQLTVDRSWLVGITAIALRTVQQVGLPPGPRPAAAAAPPIGGSGITPDRLAAMRAPRRRRWFSLLRGGPPQWTVTFDERSRDGAFPLIDSQHLTTAAALDTRDYRGRDERCSEGPIPVHCRSCSCGTCWVGVIAGAEHLSPVEPRERTTIAALGYFDSTEPQPIIRLACMAQARGPVTLVIPPWNGQIGARLDKAQSRAWNDAR